MNRPRERSTPSSVIAVAAMLAGCSKGPEATAIVGDAGADAAPARSDAGGAPALRWDCGEDTAVRIDRKDSPYPVAEAVGAGWCRVPFAPDASRYRIAFRGNLPVRMPAWGPCDGGAFGCKRIDAKAWTTYPMPFFVKVRADATGTPRMSFLQHFRQPPWVEVPWTGWEFEGTLDAEPDYVIYSATDSVDGLDHASSSSGVLLNEKPKSSDACDRIYLFAQEPRRDAFRVLADATQSCGAMIDLLRPISANRASVSAGTAMLLGSPSGTALLTMLDTRTGGARAAMIGTRRVSPGSEPHAAPGGAVIMLDEPPRYPLAFVDEVTGEGTVIVDPPRGRMAIPMGLDWSTTPPTLVWVEGDDQGFALTNVDVYASPFSRSPDGITRRKVTHIPDRYWGAGVVNAGYYVTGSDDWNKNWIIRLSDGVRWPFVIGQERGLGAFWVTSDEIFYRTGDYAAWQASGLSESAIGSFLDGLERASITALVATPPLPRIP